MQRRRNIVVDATRTYTDILEAMDEGGFLVHVPALPEVVTCGDTESGGSVISSGTGTVVWRF